MGNQFLKTLDFGLDSLNTAPAPTADVAGKSIALAHWHFQKFCDTASPVFLRKQICAVLAVHNRETYSALDLRHASSVFTIILLHV